MLTVAEYEEAARHTLPDAIYDYYVGGAEEEVTVGENADAWRRLRFRPRVLVEGSSADLTTDILGTTTAMPIMTAPCAFNVLAHPDGELAVSRAASTVGVIQVLSTMSSIPLERVAAAAPGVRWFQLYVYRDRELTREAVRQAEAAGYSALCLTVDVPTLGRRRRDLHNAFVLPPEVTIANFGRSLPDVNEGPALMASFVAQIDPGLSWEGVEWLRSISDLPVVVKGVLTGEDARLAIDHGVSGIIVSNHGGRQLDAVLPTAVALPEVVAAVDGAVEVFVDGGIRSGSDVLRALALGAKAVLIGRPYLWGLAVNGEDGVRGVLELLADDLRRCMTLAGCRSTAEITPSLVTSGAS